ncbi:meiotic recombination protein SPO11-like [Ptychodera flava]|uniref:meiotic recombination protein SPO11-like n=1 Tax=Ptychodera flava TaxID=63121 RepID=UPI00396A6ED1
MASEGSLSSAFVSAQHVNPIPNQILASLESLRQKLVQENDSASARPRPNKGNAITLHQMDRYDVLRRLETVIDHIVTSLSKFEAPRIAYNSRTTWQNIRFTESVGLQMIPNANASEVRFDSTNSVKKFGMTLQVIAMCYKLVQGNTFSTKRDMYYYDTKLFGSQSVLDDIIDNISCMIQVPRESLHILAASKGWVAGDLHYKEGESNLVDCSVTKTGIAIPANINTISDITSSAKMVLIVEKDAIFQKLLDEKLFEKIPECIMVTGRGFPDVSTRRMVKKLWDCLQIPILALVDADPHGMAILSVYKYGSRGLSFDTEQLAVPMIRWLGVLPSDIERFHIRQDSLIPLSTADLNKAREIMQRPFYTAQPMWMKEMQVMLSTNCKAEIEALTSISRSFLTDVYIPSKIADQGWI